MQNGSLIDTSLVTFESWTKSTTISIFTTDYSKTGTYNMQIKAKFSPTSTYQVIENFTLSVILHCTDTQILSIPIDDYSYSVKGPNTNPMYFTFDSWTESKGCCGPFFYMASLSDGSTLPTFITFEPFNRRFKVQYNDQIYYDEFQIILTGCLPTWGLQSAVTFKVDIDCLVYNFFTDQVT